MVTAFCSLTVIQTGETRFVVDCKVNPMASVGHVNTAFVPAIEIDSTGRGVNAWTTREIVPTKSFALSGAAL